MFRSMPLLRFNRVPTETGVFYSDQLIMISGSRPIQKMILRHWSALGPQAWVVAQLMPPQLEW